MRPSLAIMIGTLALAGAAQAQTTGGPTVQPNAATPAPSPTGNPPAGSAAERAQSGRGTVDLNDNSLTDPNQPGRRSGPERSGAPDRSAAPTDNPPAGSPGPR